MDDAYGGLSNYGLIRLLTYKLGIGGNDAYLSFFYEIIHEQHVIQLNFFFPKKREPFYLWLFVNLAIEMLA